MEYWSDEKMRQSFNHYSSPAFVAEATSAE
jgi:hypothetical protein